MSPDTTTRVAVGLQAAGHLYDVSPKTIERAIKSGALKAKKLGGKWSIRIADLDTWYEAEPEFDPENP